MSIASKNSLLYFFFPLRLSLLSVGYDLSARKSTTNYVCQPLASPTFVNLASPNCWLRPVVVIHFLVFGSFYDLRFHSHAFTLTTAHPTRPAIIQSMYFPHSGFNKVHVSLYSFTQVKFCNSFIHVPLISVTLPQSIIFVSHPHPKYYLQICLLYSLRQSLFSVPLLSARFLTISVILRMYPFLTFISQHVHY